MKYIVKWVQVQPSNRYGIEGCQEIINEINIDFDEIYCEVGTGTTF